MCDNNIDNVNTQDNLDCKNEVAIEKTPVDERDEKFMREAIKALDICPKEEVPVAAVLVVDDEIVSVGVNRRNTDFDPTAHAEVVAIRDAAKKLKRWNLSGAELFVTLEPCAMCAGAIVYSRVSRVVFGAYDVRYGACGSAINVAACESLNHRAEIKGGVLKDECLAPIQQFFKVRRSKAKDASDGGATKTADK